MQPTEKKKKAKMNKKSAKQATEAKRMDVDVDIIAGRPSVLSIPTPAQ